MEGRMGEEQSQKGGELSREWNGEYKGPLEGCACTFAQGPRVPSYATGHKHTYFNVLWLTGYSYIGFAKIFTAEKILYAKKLAPHLG